MSGIGIGTFDVGETVDKLMAKQYIKYFQLKNIKSAQDIQITAYGSLQSLFTTFQGAMQNLSNAFNTIAYQASSSNSGIVNNTTVTNNDIGTGNHSVNVTQLAQAQQYQSQAVFTSNKSGLGIAETLTFTNNSNSANNFSVQVNASDTLQNIRDNINNTSGNTGVTAAIVTSTGPGGVAQYNLVLTSNEGTASQFTISGDTGNNFNFNQTVAALDAQFTFDGFNEVRSSNVITDVIDGLNFTLSGLGTAQITVSQGTTDLNSTVQSAVTDMLTSYNQIITFLDGNQYVTTFDDKIKQKATMYNNAFTFIKSQLQTAVNTVFNGSGDIHNLLDAGIKLSPSSTVIDKYDMTPDVGSRRTSTSIGSLMIDPTVQSNGSTTLSSVLTGDFSALQEFFTNPTSGFIANVNNAINNNILAQTGNGIIPGATSLIQNQEGNTDEQIETELKRLNVVKEHLTDQFSRLNGVISRYQNLSEALEKQYAYLDNLIRSK